MVNITPEEVMEMKRAKVQFDELSNFDYTITGKSAKHLVIPMCDIYNMRRIAGILNSLAADFDQLSRNRMLTARQIVLSAKDAVDQANRSIKEMTGKGKTRKPYKDVDN